MLQFTPGFSYAGATVADVLRTVMCDSEGGQYGGRSV